MDRRSIASLGAVLLLLPACGENHKTTPNKFHGLWNGHTRRLIITPDGRGREIVDSGCCHRAITARFRVLRVSGSPPRADATIKFTYFWAEKGIFRRPPQAGDLAMLRLRNGVVTDARTKTRYCAIEVDAPDICGQ